MVISELTKRRRLLGATVIWVVLVAGLTMLWQMGGTAQAAILTPIAGPEGEETLFYDDFSGDLSQWTIVSGVWGIESGELSQNGTLNFPNCVAGSSWTNFIAEAKIKNVDSTAIGLITRYVDENNYIATYYYFADGNKDKLAVWEKVGGAWYQRTGHTFAKTANNNVWYTLKVLLSGAQIEVYLDGDLVITDNIVAGSGKIGLTSYSGHAHFDDVKVSTSSGVPSAYSMNVRTGVTQIVITCTWSGSGNITIANLTTPTTTYYESDMDIYEKTTISVEGTTSIFNIRRAMLSIAAPTSSETWTLYLNLNGVTTYQVSVEMS